MKKLLFLFIIFSFSDGFAQRFEICAGRNFSIFKYEDASGNTDTNLTYRKGLFYSLGYVKQVGSRHLISPDVYFIEAGADSKILGEPMEYRLSYVGLAVSYAYEIVDRNRYSFSSGVAAGYDHLLKGTQSVGREQYDLLKEKALKPNDLNLSLLAAGRFMITESMFFTLEYRFRYGLTQIENSNQGETTHNMGHLASIGLSFNLSETPKQP